MDTGYHLGANDTEIVAYAPLKLRQTLLLIPEARTAIAGGQPVAHVPISRENFMAVEAVASPTETTIAYREARERALRPSMEALAAVSDRLAGLSTLGQPHGLLPHQWQFLAHAYPRHGILNASEQGTGKTRSAWMMAHLWQSRRILIVCPKSLVRQWCQEWDAMWLGTPATGIVLLGDGEVRHRQEIVMDLVRDRPHTSIAVAVIVNYEVLAAMQKTLAAWEPDLLIADESWRVKTPTAGVTKAALKLAEGVHERAGHVQLLTGTPVGNHVGDLYTQLRMVDPTLVPQGKGAYSAFLNRWATMVPINFRGFREFKPTGCADPAGLIRQIAPAWFRATKASCLELPPKRYTRVPLPLRRETAALYKKVKMDGATALGAPLCLDGELQTMIHLQRLAGGFLSVPQDEFGRGWEHKPIPCPKIDWLKAWAGDVLLGDPTQRCIVWCKFLHEVARVYQSLSSILGQQRVACATGDMSETYMENTKASFQSRDEDGVQVIVAQWSKLAYGHNLQACDYNIFFSHTWSFVERAQAEDRSHRHGRTRAVQYIELVAENTIDMEIMAAMEKKQDLAARLTPETTTKLP